MFDFNSLNIEQKKQVVQGFFVRNGEITQHNEGMCGDIFIIDQGETTIPRYVCIKISKLLKNESQIDASKRFVKELNTQLLFFFHPFVHWLFDIEVFEEMPIAAYYRYWGSDLALLIKQNQLSQISKLSIMLYSCLGLKHCYERGLICHQDLKPANIFIQDISNDYKNLPDFDILQLALIADFGLANASKEIQIFDGSRPYMAPEQWSKDVLSQATDIFALGVIFYELLTDGFHPIGIRLNKFWPKPENGNSKKYTKEKEWKKWIDKKCQIKEKKDIKEIEFIEQMLSQDPKLRPNIDEVINFLFSRIKDLDSEVFHSIKKLISELTKNSINLPLEQQWPYLDYKWKRVNQFINKETDASH